MGNHWPKVILGKNVERLKVAKKKPLLDATTAWLDEG